MTKNARVRVLQIQLRYNVNASDLAEQIIAGLPVDCYDVTTLFLRGRPGVEEPVSAAARSVYFELAPAQLKGLQRWRAIWELYQFCRNEKFDVIIAHRFKPISMMMWVSCFLRAIVCIGVQHGIGDYDRCMRRIEANLLISPRWRMVGVSRAVRSYLISRVRKFNESNTLCINNAVDIQRANTMMLDAGSAREILGLPKGKRIIGCIGRLVPVKGHATLIQGFAIIAEQHPDCIVAIIGEGRLRTELESLIKKLGLQERVVLLGERQDALQYVKAFDVFSMPSFSEGLPLALLEALAGQRPVIGSDIPSLLPILQDCSGAVFRVGDSSDLAGKLGDLLALTDADLRELGELGYGYLCHQHDIRDFRNSYRQLLDSLYRKS